ncbi:MAG: hypothetical protein A2W08_03340 [Candidatus Rokubacteria bacterium RBG_16_73_20]|nr:MAG: hypothetical protein A2W08_03340 [Candidatus Rokubacteria bacterium RBG_16_73_20]
MIVPALLRGRDRYERAMEGWVDNTHPDAFTHTVRLDDADHAVEVAVVALPPPSYAIREARCRAVRGTLGPAVADGLAAPRGAPPRRRAGARAPRSSWTRSSRSRAWRAR